MSLQQGYLHPLACIPLTLSSPMPGQHNGRLLYSQCGPFLPFPTRSGPNPRGVLPLCFSELGSNCLKRGGLVKHLLCRAALDLCSKLLCWAVRILSSILGYRFNKSCECHQQTTTVGKKNPTENIPIKLQMSTYTCAVSSTKKKLFNNSLRVCRFLFAIERRCVWVGGEFFFPFFFFFKKKSMEIKE